MVVDLPRLLSIELGHFSLQGDEAAFSSYVKMKSNVIYALSHRFM